MAKPPKIKTNSAFLKEILIGQQTWMSSNLDVKTFRNGDEIFEAKTKDDWQRVTDEKIPAWCYYENSKKNGKQFGALYNWYAVSDARGLAPEGWHIPSSEEWQSLINFLGPEEAGKKLKTVKGWGEGDDDSNGTDEVSFSGQPGGCRFTSFVFLGENCYYWTSTPGSSSTAISKILGSVRDSVRHWVSAMDAGMYVRCVKGKNIIWK